MDHKIVDKLIQFGLITNVGIDADKYTDIDDLIAKGIITVPGAKTKIMELIGRDHIVIEELPIEDDAVEDDTVVDAPVEEESIIKEVVEDDVEPETEVVESENVETEIKVETKVIAETPNKSKKSKKN